MNGVSEMVVTEKGIENKMATQQNPLAILGQKYNEVNNVISDLAQLEAETQEELTDIRKEIASLTLDLKKRQKELRNRMKAIASKRMVVLGERTAYVNQIQSHGGKIGNTDITKLLS